MVDNSILVDPPDFQAASPFSIRARAAFGTTIRRRVAFQRVGDQLVKPVEVLRLPTQLIVEAQHFADEPGADLKWQSPCVTCGVVGRSLCDGFPVECVQSQRGMREAGVKKVVQLIAGDQQRPRVV